MGGTHTHTKVYENRMGQLKQNKEKIKLKAQTYEALHIAK